MIAKLYKIMCVGCTAVMLSSCIDTIILPEDKTVDEDFWQTKEDVASMVNGAYAAMTSADVLTRLIVWGDFRTDEVNIASSIEASNGTIQALNEIAAVNMQTTNTYGDWGAFYNVINRCNIVLERAAEVMQIDPNYTQGDYLVDRSQMLALRALCYFYLVRNYRDLPYITKAYMNSSQDMNVPQSSPLEVLGYCITDLEEAAKTALSAKGYTQTDWRRVGWMTDDAINSLLADIYLWRASVTHSQADYQQCVAYCDKVIDSKKNQHVRGRNEVTEKAYPLADASDMYNDIFVEQNAEESIFELQVRSNLPVVNYFYKYKSASASSGVGFLRATPMFGSTVTAYNATDATSQTALYTLNDLRYYAACYLPSSGEESYDIRKIISNTQVTSKNATKSREAYDYGGLDRNYNIYRLSDILLMKAEALVQQVDTAMDAATQQQLLQEPFTLVQAVNTRALYRENQADSMKWATFKNLGREDFEKLVLQERLREFCFEGRRWYDLMRYNYRHVNGVDYSKTMMDQIENGGSLPANSEDMLKLMTHSRGTEASGVMAKMANEAYLYMPVPNRDIIVCPLLKQNPAYKNTNEFEKSY